MTEEGINLLRKRLCAAMTELGFEEMVLNNKKNHVLNGKYVIISCYKTYAVIEVAANSYQAEHNLYEDLDMYEYAYMENMQMDIFNEMKQDIIKYVIGKYM